MDDLSVFDRIDVMKQLIESYRRKKYVPDRTLSKLVAKKRRTVEDSCTLSILQSPRDLDKSYRDFLSVRECEETVKRRKLAKYNNRWKDRLIWKLVKRFREDDAGSYDSDAYDSD